MTPGEKATERERDRERRGMTKGVQASELIYVREGASLNAIRRLCSCTTAIAQSDSHSPKQIGG